MQRDKQLWFAAFAISWASCPTGSVTAQPSLPDCLYSFTRGTDNIEVAPCGEDSAKVGKDANVQAVMQTFGLRHNSVIFQSCPGGRFSAMPDSKSGDRYLVTYPSNLNRNYLAPITHELAHVLQMKNAGGLAALRDREEPRRIELGADFLAGLAHAKSLKKLSIEDFETNLQLAGTYKLAADHGPPEYRGQAFRIGSTAAPPYRDLSILDALKYWNANGYPSIRQ